MLVGDALLQHLNAVLDSDISSYAIADAIGISRMSIGRYRSGETLVENMTLRVALALERFGEENGLYETGGA